MLDTHEIKLPEEGKHTGIIEKVLHRETEEGYKYTDIEILLNDVEPKISLRVSIPTQVSRDKDTGEPKSKLAGILVSCGIDISEPKVDEMSIIGIEVSFMTINKKVEGKGTFANILEETIKKVK